MKNIEKWLTENNLQFEKWEMTGGAEGLLVKTDYEGPYPTRETFQKIHLIESKIRNFKRLTTETRGHYTAVLIK